MLRGLPHSASLLRNDKQRCVRPQQRSTDPNHNRFTRDGHAIAGDELLSFTGFHGVVETHTPFGDHLLGRGSAVGEPAELDELTQLDRDLANDHIARRLWIRLGHRATLSSEKHALNREIIAHAGAACVTAALNDRPAPPCVSAFARA